MKRLLSSLVIFLLAAVLAPAATADKPTAPLPSTAATAKVISYSEKDVIAVKAKIRFTTLLVLPKQEQILDYTCGDKEFWVVNGTQNLAYVKPAKTGSRTNLNLITASGNVYSFVLTEISESADSEPDLKIFIEPKDESMLSSANGQPRFVAAQQIEDYRQQVEIAKQQATDAQEAARAAIERQTSEFRQQYPENLKFEYRFAAGKPPFNVTAMYHDGKFTYIQAHPQEPPALYEVKDGKPNLVQFEFRNGTYVASKVLDDGYLAVGKQKLPFTRVASAEK
jgi:type IV secretory pathway VirB9-like protein